MDASRLVIPCLIGCGRIGFDSGGEPPLGDGAPGDSSSTALLSAQATCQSSPTTLTLDRAAAAGDTLMAAFFLREPQGGQAPTIAGATGAWTLDAAFTSVSSTNRRHLSLFRAQLATAVPAGTPIEITHVGAQSSGAALFILPTSVTRSNEVPSTYEGQGAFFGAHTTAGATTLCGLVHHNGAAVEFAPEWRSFHDMTSNCGGGARQTAAMHLRVGPGGAVDCAGTLDNDALTWITVLVGYADFP